MVSYCLQAAAVAASYLVVNHWRISKSTRIDKYNNEIATSRFAIQYHRYRHTNRNMHACTHIFDIDQIAVERVIHFVCIDSLLCQLKAKLVDPVCFRLYQA